MQKQKIKIFTIFKKPFAIASLAAVFISLVSAFFFNPSSTEAQTTRVNYKPEDVKFEISVNDNFFRTYDGGNVQFVATVKLVTPDQLVTGALVNDSDCITIGDSACTANKVDGVSIGVINKTQNSTACGPGQQGAFSCNFIKMAQTQTPSIIKKGEPITFNFSLSSTELKSLQVTSSNEGAISEIYVYPFLQMSRFRLSFANGAKSVFVQSYSTQAQYDANKNNSRPEGVPANGSVTSSPTINKTGDPLLGLINNFINIIVGMAQQLIYWVFYLFVAPFIQAMLSIQTYTDTFAAVIYPGWEVVRNACNILFIVALIAIGLGTLFRVESYQYKHLLVDLIIAALLVNFSLVIAQVILGVADTVQSQFLPNNLEVIRSLAKDLMAGFKTADFSHIADAGYFSTTLQPLFSLGLSIGSFIVFASIAGFLGVRIVMLWVLLMLSPLAYAMRILPQTKSYTGMWWGQFIKYAFFTPVMAFFLNMAAVINNSYNSQLNNKTGIFQQIINDPSILGNSDIAAFVFRVGGNVIILVFLFVAIKVAEGAGVYGADAVAKAAKGGMMAPFAGVGWLGEKSRGYIGRKWNEKTSHLVEGRKVGLGKRIAFAALNPIAVAKGWKKRSEELKHAAEGEAEAVGLMVVEQTMSKGKAFNRKAIAERAHDSDFLKNYGDLTREEAIDTAYDVATMANNMDGRAARRAIIEANMQEGWIDDIIQEAQENGRGKELIAQMKNLKSEQYRIRDEDFEVSEMKDKEGNIIYEKNEDGSIKVDEKGKKISKKKRNLKYNEKTRRALYLAMFGEHISSHVDKDGHKHEHVALADQTAAKMLADAGEKHGRSTRHAEYMATQVYDAAANDKEGGYGFYDLQYATEVIDEDGSKHKVVNGYAQSGQYKGQFITTVNAGADHARREVAKMGAREQAGIAHHAVMDISNGKLDKDMFRVVSKALLDSPGFAQERSANYLIAGTDDIEEINRITKKYFETGELDVDSASMQRVKDMFEVNPAAAEIVLRKFLNKTSGDGPNEVRARKLLVPKYDPEKGKVVKVNLLPETPAASTEKKK